MLDVELSGNVSKANDVWEFNRMGGASPWEDQRVAWRLQNCHTQKTWESGHTMMKGLYFWVFSQFWSIYSPILRQTSILQTVKAIPKRMLCQSEARCRSRRRWASRSCSTGAKTIEDRQIKGGASGLSGLGWFNDEETWVYKTRATRTSGFKRWLKDGKCMKMEWFCQGRGSLGISFHGNEFWTSFWTRNTRVYHQGASGWGNGMEEYGRECSREPTQQNMMILVKQRCT